jgi:hypothetical protein
MRIVLIIPVILMFLFSELDAQNDFRTLDRKMYEYYLKSDYINLKRTADTMLSLGIDYYYLRVRLGLTEYNIQKYSSAVNDLSRAIEFNSLDTTSHEYIYNSYMFSGRKTDAMIYLKAIPDGKKNIFLQTEDVPFPTEFFFGFSGGAYDVVTYQTNSLNYEAVKSNSAINAGVEAYFLKRFKGTLAYSSFHKSGTRYSPLITSGENLNFNQNQVYAKISGSLFPGWEFSVFSHTVFYNEAVTQGMPGNRIIISQQITESLGGIGISKNLWKIHTGANISFSNFSNSNQIRGEGYFTLLPSGNLNLYLTSGLMSQRDKIWGGTYQVSQEIGLKIFKSLWLEAGLINGNSFLYGRNQGSMLNNSFQIPVTTIYSNLIILPGRHLNITITPYYSENNIYSWDLTAYSRTNKLIINSFGGLIKFTYKYR